MIRMLAILAALLGLAAVVAIDAPTAGGAPAVTATYASEPRILPAVCPGAQTIPVGDIQSGDAELDSGSDDVAFDVLPEGGVVIDQGAVFDGVGMSLERIGSGDIAGLAGLSCAPTAREQWLVGGSTVLGASARLVLSNPADSSVRAEVALHTAVGPVDGVTSVVIGPGAQRTVLLEAIEPEMPAVAVHITAGGLGVSAALQDSRLDGFAPAGSDWVVASAVGDSLGVHVPVESDGGTTAMLSLFAPDGAEVSLAMASSDGAVPWLGDSELTLDPGVLTEVPVPVAGPGTVLIDASAPVTASVRARVARDWAASEGERVYDLAWTGAQRRSDVRERAAIVPAGQVVLQVHSDVAGTATFEAEGETLEVPVSPDVTALVQLNLEPGTRLSSSSESTWTLVVTDLPGFITTLEPVSVELESEDTTVTVGGTYPELR
ncbi:MAG: DUF5719 family protein [Demequina sp.]